MRQETISELRRALEDPGIVAELISLYLEDAPRQVESIKAAVMEGNAERLALAAHTLKGSSAQLGAEELSELCSELENIALDWRAESASLLIDQLESTLADACTVFQSHYQSLSR